MKARVLPGRPASPAKINRPGEDGGRAIDDLVVVRSRVPAHADAIIALIVVAALAGAVAGLLTYVLTPHDPVVSTDTGAVTSTMPYLPLVVGVAVGVVVAVIGLVLRRRRPGPRE